MVLCLEQLGFWDAGMLRLQQLGCWDAGMLCLWQLACWDAGILGCRDAVSTAAVVLSLAAPSFQG